MPASPDSTASRRLTGRPQPLPEALTLRAGPVTLLLDGADLRHVRLGETELVQRVYMAVRDAPWNTIPGVFSNWRVDQGPDSFRVTFDARHAHEAIDFTWCGVIEGDATGRIRYELDGTCHGSFKYSKIGFNVHHALEGTIGHAYRAATESGELRGILAKAIEPQRIVGGTLTGMFAAHSEFAVEVVPGLEAVVALEGDLLELQDHRNWADGNFKSYGTPLSLGFPFDAVDGQRIRQVLTVSWLGDAPATPKPDHTTITLGAPAGRLPAIGFGQPSHGQPLSSREGALLAAVRPAHLRVDVALGDPEAPVQLGRALADARLTGASLELAVHANEAGGPALAALAASLREGGVRVSRVLVYPLQTGYSALAGLTPAPIVALVREHLAPVTGPVPFAGGTNQSFSDINRERPTDPVLSGLCFSACPTVHAADDRSIVENLIGLSEVVEMARTFAGDRRIAVSPVTIATRFGPYPAGPTAPGDLPAPVDVRQASLLGAAWTAASIARLALGGADSVTYYETSGWRGILERDGGSPDERFPSAPGDVFPLYHVFADVAPWGTGSVRDAISSDPLQAQALAVEDETGLRVLVACLSPKAGRVTLVGLPGTNARIRVLDIDSVESAMTNPGAFRSGEVEAAVDGGRLDIEFAGYAVARIDLSRG